MTPPRRRIHVTPVVLVVLAATLAAAPAQEDCPPQSRSPQCVDSTDEGDTTPGGGSQAPDNSQTPDRGQAPPTPPGQEADAEAEEPSDPQPDRGADTPPTGPTDGAPTSPSRPSRPSRPTSPEVASDGAPGTDDPSLPADEGAVEEPVPPPPPDLGARRVLATRLSRGPAGPQLAVGVEETRARGVDGGWTVTVTGTSGIDTAVGARSRRPEGPVGLIVGRTPRSADAPPGFTVVGQRSSTVYDASYHGVLPMGPPPVGTPTVITVTLFQ